MGGLNQATKRTFLGYIMKDDVQPRDATADGYESLLRPDQTVWRIQEITNGSNLQAWIPADNADTGEYYELIRGESNGWTGRKGFITDKTSFTDSTHTTGQYFGIGGQENDISIDEIWFSNNFDKDATYSFGDEGTPAGVTANYSYTIDKTGTIDFSDLSTSATGIVNDWNWLSNGSTAGFTDANDQNAELTAVELTDYNVQLCVGDDLVRS